MKRYDKDPTPDIPVVQEAAAVYHSTPRRRSRIVRDMIHPQQRSHSPSSRELVELLKDGLSVTELEDLQDSLEIPMEKLMDVLGIAKSTLHRRRKGDQRLDTPQSDRVIRFARLLRRAVEVFESEPEARHWLKAPQFGLGGEVPLKYAQTEVGAREVEDLLGRIDHAVYS